MDLEYRHAAAGGAARNDPRRRGVRHQDEGEAVPAGMSQL